MSRCLPVALVLLGVSAACGGSNTALPRNPPAGDRVAASNANIPDPALTIADNQPVSRERGLRLVWSDEFDGDRIDPRKWFFESGDGSDQGLPGWGNNELQWYAPENAALRDGRLVITARREERGGRDFTSARISTVKRFAFRYGRIEAGMKLPAGQGLWSAFWLLPHANVYGKWAASGEIDVMEAVNLDGSGGDKVLGTIHYGAQWPDNRQSGKHCAAPVDVTSEFHEYSLEWGTREFRWYVDDVLCATQTTWSTIAAPFPAPFDRPFYILFNLAVGGNLPGSPGADLELPAAMEVDYVRVFSGDY